MSLSAVSNCLCCFATCFMCVVIGNKLSSSSMHRQLGFDVNDRMNRLLNRGSTVDLIQCDNDHERPLILYIVV